MIYRGSTSCGPCGNNGTPAKDFVKEDLSGKCVLVSSDLGSLATAKSTAFNEVFAVYSSKSSYPYAWYSGHGSQMKVDSIYTTISANKSIISGYVNTINSNAPSVGIGGAATKSGAKINIKVNAYEKVRVLGKTPVTKTKITTNKVTKAIKINANKSLK